MEMPVDARMDILAELSALREHVKIIQGEIAAVRHPKATEDRLHSASQELDAIVSATEGATNRILEIAESIGDTAAELPGLAEGNAAIQERSAKLDDLVANLFTECSFQDITGQRVNKVIATLSFVEERITRIISSFGDSFDAVPVPETAKDADKQLLNGPQLDKSGVSQADIDNLFG